MKYVRALCIVALLVLIAGASHVNAAPTLTLNSPNGGECFVIGNTYTVNWSSSENAHFAFYYVKNTTASANPPSTGSWTVHPISATPWSWTPISSDATDSGNIWIEGHDASHSRQTIDGSNDVFAVRTECSAPSISNVDAGSIDQDSAIITWTTNEASKSQVEYGATTNYGTKTSIQQTGGVTGHSVTLSNLTKGTTYHYRVISQDLAGNTATSGDFSLTTTGGSDNTKPGAITTLTVKSVSGNSVQLEWTASGDDGATGQASSYDLRYSTNAITSSNWNNATRASGEPTPASTGNVQSFTVSNLSPETKYYFAIRAIDEAGNISDLDTTSITATTGTDTASPVISNIALSNVTQTSAKITWTTDEPAKYRIDYGTTASYGQTASGTALNTSHNVTLSSLVANTTYHYRIIATDSKNNSSDSGDRLLVTDAPLSLYFTASQFSVTPGQNVTLSWSAGSSSATCSASGGWSGSKSYTGSQQVTVNSTTEYTLTCSVTGSPPSVTQSVIIATIGVDISSLRDGDLIRVSSLPGEDGRNVWIVKISADRTKLYRRLILNPSIFTMYRHLNPAIIKEISVAVRDTFKVSNYVRTVDPPQGINDPKVYLLVPNTLGDDGVKHHINVSGPTFAATIDTFAVFIINRFERDSYVTGNPLTSVLPL